MINSLIFNILRYRPEKFIKYDVSFIIYFNLGIDRKQGGKQTAPKLAPVDTPSNGIINYWAYETSTVLLPCFSYGNPPPLTRYFHMHR